MWEKYIPEYVPEYVPELMVSPYTNHLEYTLEHTLEYMSRCRLMLGQTVKSAGAGHGGKVVVSLLLSSKKRVGK